MRPVALVVMLAACANNATRHTPVTPMEPPRVEVPRFLREVPVAVELEVGATEISGAHHEGLLQVKQPGLFGLSDEQKQQLYGSAKELTVLGVIAELKRQGLDVRLGTASADGAKIAGRVGRITLNTYGDGIGGFGSAGDYWEARLELDGVTLWRRGGTRELGRIEAYAKLSPSPAKMGWAAALQSIIAMAQIMASMAQLAAGSISGTSFPAMTYDLETTPHSPVEIAGRHAAAEILRRLAAPPR